MGELERIQLRGGEGKKVDLRHLATDQLTQYPRCCGRQMNTAAKVPGSHDDIMPASKATQVGQPVPRIRPQSRPALPHRLIAQRRDPLVGKGGQFIDALRGRRVVKAYIFHGGSSQ